MADGRREPRLTVLFDVHVLDYLADHSAELHMVKQALIAGRLRLLAPHLLDDELNAIGPARAERYAQLALVRVSLDFECVSTYGFVHGVSGPGRSDLMSWEHVEDFDALSADNPRHAEDALLALTARANDAILVTSDVRASRRARAPNIPVVSPDELMPLVYRALE